MKRILSLTLILVLLISAGTLVLSTGSMQVSADASARPSPVELTTRDDFAWGVNLHSPNFVAYPKIYLEERMNLSAKLGSGWIRLNGSIPDDGDWSYLDAEVGLANKYGMKIVMVTNPSQKLGLDYITLYCETLARRYNGENGRGYVDVFQVWNETDATLLQAKYGSGGAEGTSVNHYYTINVEGAADLPEYLEYFTAARQGIDNAGGKSKFMINFCAMHWGCLKYYMDAGLKIDVIGWDDYSWKPYDLEESAADMQEHVDRYYNELYKLYPVPVLMTEINVHMGRVNQADRVNPSLEVYDALIDMMYIYYKEPWIKGGIFYELLDELNYGVDNQEAYFGLVNCENGGKIGEPKPIYYKLQTMLKGDKTLRTINRDEVDYKPYEALVVDTADDSHITDGTEDFVPPVADNTTDTGDSGWDDDDFDIDTDGLELDDEPVIENVVNPVKNVKLKETTTEKPWGLFLIFGSIMLVIPAAYVVIYILIRKKKAAKAISQLQ